MRVAALVLLIALVQDSPGPLKPQKTALTLSNSSESPIPAGRQVRVRNPAPKKAIHVHHRGKSIPLAIEPDRRWIWFRLVQDLAPGKSDENYELRFDVEKEVQDPRAVFEFFEDFLASEVDPARWEWDREIRFEKTVRGLGVKALPPDRNEYATAFFKPLVKDVPQDFIMEVDLAWALGDTAAFSFLILAELDDKTETKEADRVRAAGLISDLGAEEIETRERATRELVKMGPIAYPQLEEAARSQGAETRARAISALSAILRENPPPALAVGLATRLIPRKEMAITSQVGKSRTTLIQRDSHLRGTRVQLQRDPAGEATLKFGLSGPPPARVPGRVKGFRLCFWSPAAGEIGEFGITRIVVRRYVEEMPDAAFAPIKD